ncbi:dihydroxyacetone kinase subunit M-like protein [uncultured Mediterranean phage uvMED]|nr:dihydroxyacetone kinase subunit M-like protein [uncultured Mediterranean phage uvMED]
MEIEEIISEKDRILNELFENLITTDDLVSDELRQLTPAQSYRQRAVQTFLSKDFHHMDLEELMNTVLTLRQQGNEEFMKNKLLKYHKDVYELNKKAGGEGSTIRTSILPQGNTLSTIISEGKLSQHLDNAIDAEKLDVMFNSVIRNINKQELYYGIRHVMPESIEMRMLINYGEDYIDMLEKLNRPSFNADIYADLDYDRITPSISRARELGIKNLYIAPNNIQELKEMHQRFLQEFPKKVKEFVLGQNVYVDLKNRDAILMNEEYYQYTGMGTSSPDMPSIQMSNNVQEIYDKLLGREKNDLMYKKAVSYGFEDANEWFEAVYKEVDTNGPNTILWDKASRELGDVAADNVANRMNEFFTKPVWNENFPDEIGFEMGRVLPENPIYNAVSNPLDPTIGITEIDTPTNVVDDVKTLDIENYKPITIEVLDEAGLHARPAGELVSAFSKQNIPITILQDGNLKEVQMIGLLQQQKLKGETLNIYIPKDANINLDEVGGVKVVPTNVVDDINNKAINQAGEVIDIADDTTTDLSKVVGKGGYKRFEQLAKKAPEFVGNLFNTTKKLVGKTFGAAQVLDPGDVAITQGLTKILPRLGLASISLPALAAYTAYELAILVVDVGQAYNKAIENQGGQRDFIPSFMGGKTIEGEEPEDIDYDWKQIGKDTWEEMGAISDTWSLSWKISEPIIDSVFKQSASMSQEK